MIIFSIFVQKVIYISESEITKQIPLTSMFIQKSDLHHIYLRNPYFND